MAATSSSWTVSSACIVFLVPFSLYHDAACAGVPRRLSAMCRMVTGAGADGGATPRFAAYGSTKRGLVQFQKSLSAELKLQKLDNVVIHNLSPGMVTTGASSQARSRL